MFSLFRFAFGVIFCVALASLVFAGDGHRPALAEDSGDYVAAQTCLGCHKAEASAWQHSDHDWAMREATEASVLGDFDGVVFDSGGSKARFFRKEGKYFVNTEGADGKRADFEILYTFGFAPLQQYLVAFPGGRLQALTIAWDSRPQAEGGQRWFSLYPDESFSPDNPLHWTGRYQNWNSMCAECHSTNLLQNYDDRSDTFATTWHEQSVGCQGCHGPGRKHVVWAQDGGGKSTEQSNPLDVGLEVDFGSIGSTGLVDQCGYCHSRREGLGVGQQHGRPLLDSALPSVLSPGFYHADGQIQGEVYVYSSFLQSKMYAAGVGCIDCHDPHTTKLRIDGNGLCIQCHNESPGPEFPGVPARSYDTPEHHRHSPGTAGAQCVNCHMPAKTYMQVDPRRDHSFRVPRPDLNEKTDSPDACTSCHQSQSPEWAAEIIADWFEKVPPSIHFGETLNTVRLNELDSFGPLAELIGNLGVPDIVRATAVQQIPSSVQEPALQSLSKALSDESALVRAYAIPGFAERVSSGQLHELFVLLDDPVRAVRDEALAVLAGVPVDTLSETGRDDFEEQLAEFENRLRKRAALPGERLKLGVFFERLGRIDDARRQFEWALEMDRYFTPARINLVHLAIARQRPLEAENLLQEAVGLEGLSPGDRGSLAYMLALLLVEQGNQKEALQWLESASANVPENSRIRYNHGLLLLQMQRPEEALKVLLAGLRAKPSDADLLYATVYLFISRGQRQDALEYAKRMQKAAPTDPRLPSIMRWIDGQR